MTAVPAWKAYQEAVRDFFLSLGLEAHVDAKVPGVRATHAVDVYITFMKFGIQHRWLVECKFWQTAVPKEKVLAFHAILLDIGADKGFLISESGFQAAAMRAAASTNILLTSLAILKAEAQDELRGIALDTRLRSVEQTMASLGEISRRQEHWSEDGTVTGRVPTGFYELFGRVSLLETSLRHARRGAFPVLLDPEIEGDGRITADVPRLLAFADALLTRANHYVEANKDFGRIKNTAS